MKIDEKSLNKEIADGYISRRKHPDLDIYIHSYTKKCVAEQKWNEMTTICRGLVTDSKYNVIARAFDKFYNLFELEETLPDLVKNHGNYKVYEKMDGSLGIVFYYKDKWVVATKGSFTSDQAEKAYDLISFNSLDKDLTHMFEIIYPENRVVVDYGDSENAFYLYSRKIDGTYVYSPGNHEMAPEQKKMKDKVSNKEGYVLVFEDQTRVKIKFEEYVFLHRFMTQNNIHSSWQKMKNGIDINEQYVEEEYRSIVFEDIQNLHIQYCNAVSLAHQAAKEYDFRKTRKENARNLYKKYSNDIVSLIFLIVDSNDITDSIWKKIEPYNNNPSDWVERKNKEING